MRTAIAGPLTAVGGFQRNAAVFKPSPLVKLFASGSPLTIDPMTVSKVRPPMLFVLFVAERMSYERTQRSCVAVAHRLTPATRLPEPSTNNGLLRVIVVPPMTRGLFGSGTKFLNKTVRAVAV